MVVVKIVVGVGAVVGAEVEENEVAGKGTPWREDVERGRAMDTAPAGTGFQPDLGVVGFTYPWPAATFFIFFNSCFVNVFTVGSVVAFFNALMSLPIFVVLRRSNVSAASGMVAMFCKMLSMRTWLGSFLISLLRAIA